MCWVRGGGLSPKLIALGPMADDAALKSGLPEPATPTTPTPGTHRDRNGQQTMQKALRRHAPNKDKAKAVNRAPYREVYRRPALRAKSEIPKVINAPEACAVVHRSMS